MMKNTLLFLPILCFLNIANAQVGSFFDFHASPSSKAFNSKAKKLNLWEQIDYDCGMGKSNDVGQSLGKDIIRKSQSHLESMYNGNARMACVVISPIKNQTLNSKLFNNSNRRQAVSCIYGINADEIFLRTKDRDYFNDVVEHILFLRRNEHAPHEYNGNYLTYIIPRDDIELRDAFNDPNVLGMVLTIEGGHSLGHSVYIENGLTDTKEYENLVIRNLDKLKGLVPLVDNTAQILDAPILYITLAQNFENGLVGNSQYYSKAQEDFLGKESALDAPFTELGKKVVARMLDGESGRRIYVDVAHMSIEGRKWYHQYLDNLTILGNSIPMIASHVGVSGLSYNDSRFKAPDDERKNLSSYLNLWKQSLTLEDIQKIVATRGIAGISLDPQVLGGDLFKVEVLRTVQGSSQQRELATKIILANVFTFVKSSGSADAWNCLTIGSDFDQMLSAMPAYENSEAMQQLYRDINAYLENPTDLFNLFTSVDVKRFMFGLSAKELTDRLMHKNAYNFLMKHLKPTYLENLPAPSLKGNAEFRLKSYPGARSVTLAGDFNNWSKTAAVFGKEGDDWVCRINLKPGIYRYKFVVDSKWITDPANPDTETDNMNNTNSVRVVK